MENFFHDQGITIVTIQPEFIPSTVSADLSASTKCLFECQSIECAPKTCCSTDNLASVVVDKPKKKCKHKYLKKTIKVDKSKSDKKCHSFLSLNVVSLSSLGKLNGSTAHDVIKKSISESHVDNMSLNPNGREDKRRSESSLTESCTSDCENSDAAFEANTLAAPNTCDNGEQAVPEIYKANFAKKIEAEAKCSTFDVEQNGLLNSESLEPSSSSEISANSEGPENSK